MQSSDTPATGTPPGPRPWVTPAVESAVATIAMAAMTLIVFANVVVRYFTSASLAFTEEFAVFLMVAMTFFGAAAAAARNHHIRVTIIVDHLPSAWRRPLTVAVETISAATFLWLGWLCALQTWDSWEFEDVTPGLGTPMWIYWAPVPVMCVVIALRVLGRCRRDLSCGGGGGHEH